ncbi:MAG TPA: hypothetical protein DCG75_10390 [Bacteroidales bacterium]|jgi:hypothetical protein|nr:hypothetical protein [Bacteroidales bacterium]
MNFGINSILIFFISVFNLLHPVHVTITNLDYYPNENKITMSFKVFESDFQLLFAHLYELKIDFDDPENINVNQYKINEYFSAHFKIGNNPNHSLLFQNIKKEDDSIWFYYEALVDKEIKSFEISNTIFLDLYFDQKNMLIFNYNQHQKGYLFNLNQTKQIINLNDF